ncbi:MAG TPA: hypothetical protein VJP59_09120 [Gemmatimonadota bacterium]|nr:hypothetical protein [Gemmatimonadota bacterium]
MPSGASFSVSSAAEGQRVLDRFNGFHDGFIQRIEIVSRDRFEEIGVQTADGVYDVTIEFAHYNYPDGKEPFHPVDQIIEARFSDVEDIRIDLAREFLGSPITALYFEAETRRRNLSTDREDCLALHWGRQRYVEAERKYDFRKDRLFTFSRSELRER